MARGLSKAEAAKLAPCRVETLYDWTHRHHEAYHEAIEREMADPRRPLAPLLPKSVATYDAILENEGNPAVVRAGVAKDVMDRAWGKPIVRTQTELQADIRIVFADASVDAR